MLNDPLSSRMSLPLRLAGYAGRRHSNLALALILLPEDRRRDAFLFHDFCRAIDDLADTGTESAETKLASLDDWVTALRPGEEEKLPVDFTKMIRRRDLDRRLLTQIVLGMKMDVDPEGKPVRYLNFEELRGYCWRVASAVGLLSATIFGAEGDAVERYAGELGLALQLTNILRDVAEDATMNRIYLPLEDLARFGVLETDILEGRDSPMMTHLLNHQAERADSYFARAELAWSAMSLNQRRLMRPARLMSAIYRDLLLQMHQDRYDVLQKNYRVSKAKKFLLAIRVLTGK
jgi:phytoene synthase